MENTDKALATLLERIDTALAEHAGTAAGIAVKAVQIDGIATLCAGVAFLVVAGVAIPLAFRSWRALSEAFKDGFEHKIIGAMSCFGLACIASVGFAGAGAGRLLSTKVWIAVLSPESAIALRIMEAL